MEFYAYNHYTKFMAITKSIQSELTEKPLRVALVLDDFYPSSSGVSRSIQSQINELTKMGQFVTLIAPEKYFSAPNNAKYITLKSVQPPGALKHTAVLSHSQKTAKHISTKHHFDIIHSQTDTGALTLAARIANIQNIPHIHTFHTNMAGSIDYYSSPKLIAATLAYRSIALQLHKIRRKKITPVTSQHPLLKDLPKLAKSYWKSQALMANTVDAIVTPSKYMLKYIQAAAPNKEFYKRSIPNGYNDNLYNLINQTKGEKNPEIIRFISIGRVSDEKRVDVMVDAFTKANIPNSELILIGDGNQISLIEEKIISIPNIKLLGQIHDLKKIARQLKRSDVFVLSSYHFDNQPMVILEALAADLPILYCDDQLDVGVDETNSLITLPSADSICEGMRKLANDKKLREKLSHGSNKKCPELSSRIMAEKYLALYREIIKRKTSE